MKNAPSARCLCALAALAVAALSSPARASIINWTFANGSTGTADPTTITTSEVTGGTISIVHPHANVTMLSNAAPSTGYTGASGTYNALASFNTGAVNPSTSTGWTFTLTAAPNTTLNFTNISFAEYSSSSGPVSMWLYSDQGTSSLTSWSVGNDSTWRFVTPPSFNVSTSGTITFTLYGADGGTSSNGNGRLDDMTLTYTAVPTPEPASLGVLGMGAVALLARRKATR